MPRPHRPRLPLFPTAAALLLAGGCDPTSDPAPPDIAELLVRSERALVLHPEWPQYAGGPLDTAFVEMELPLVVPSGIGSQLTVLAVTSVGDTSELAVAEVEWSSSAASILSVSADGFATAHAAGEAAITARLVDDPGIEATVPALALPGYTITDLGFVPTALNDEGWITGISEAGHAVLWDGTSLTELGDFEPVDINNLGVVVGTRRSREPPYALPRIWQDGVLADLPLGEFIDAEVAGINDAGRVAGLATDADYGIFGVVWHDGQIDTLPSAGPYDSYGTIISGGAQPSIGIVGIEGSGAVLGQTEDVAAIWEGSGRTDFEGLQVIFDRNAEGTIVGTERWNAGGGAFGFNAVAVSAAGQTTSHGSGYPGGGGAIVNFAGLLAISDEGTMVGEYEFYNVSEPLYVHPGLPAVRLRKLLDLPRPTVTPIEGMCAAVDINEAGQIVLGPSVFQIQEPCAGTLLLDPIPF